MKQSKIILGIETSCDETSAAVLEQKDDRIQILSNIVGSSADLQSKYGGVIPEQAAREQLKSIIPVIKEALSQANVSIKNIDSIAVTQGPGLIGSLLVGVETAKVLARIWNKPLIPVNHLIGHFYANWIDASPSFPCIGLLVSGGHSDLVLFKDHGQFEYLGGTRDDAAGECFDKSARLIGYAYPGGPKISKIGAKGNPQAFSLPRPMSGSSNFDFSFSGLKTAFANLVQQQFNVTSIDPDNAESNWKRISLDETNLNEDEQKLADLCASVEQAIIDSLIKKTVQAVQKYDVEQLIVAGGVAANKKLREELEKALVNSARAVTINFPPPILCTDNAAMIAAAAFFIGNQAPTVSTYQYISTLDIQANPNLSLAY